MDDAMISQSVRSDGFVILDAGKGDNPVSLIARRRDWAGFAASWNDMPRDTYMADGGRYRRRKYRVFDVGPDGIALAPHQPHYQTLDFNHLNGGVERWFEPIADDVAMSPVMTSLIAACQRVFEPLSSGVRRWHVEVHQFRIEAEPGKSGNPTPEGMHRDGTDYVMVLMVTRENIASGTTTLADDEGRKLGSFTLTQAGDCVLLDDRRVYHGVTPVEAFDASRPAYRDVLVVTFKKILA